MVIQNASTIAVQIRKLKDQGRTDRQIAEILEMSVNRVHYIRSKYGIGGRYALYAAALAGKKPKP